VRPCRHTRTHRRAFVVGRCRLLHTREEGVVGWDIEGRNILLGSWSCLRHLLLSRGWTRFPSSWCFAPTFRFYRLARDKRKLVLYLLVELDVLGTKGTCDAVVGGRAISMTREKPREPVCWTFWLFSLFSVFSVGRRRSKKKISGYQPPSWLSTSTVCPVRAPSKPKNPQIRLFLTSAGTKTKTPQNG